MKKLLILTLVIALCAIVFPHLFAHAQDQNLSGSAAAARQEQDLAKFFRRHERLKLYTSQVAEQVRKHIPVAIYTPSAAFDLALTPHDMRAPNYRAVEVGADGVARPVEMGPVRTYQGKVLGRDDAQARFTVDDESLEGLIVTPEERYMVEPVRKYSAGADTTDFVLYRASDVIQGQKGGAGQEPIDYELRHTATGFAPKVNEALAPDAVTAVRDIELATEADAEYVNSLGSSAAANNDILSIMNMVEGIYQQQLDLTFTIVFQHTWTNAATDPYSATAPGGCYNNTICGQPPAQLDPRGIINEFMEYWNTNFPPGSPSANNPARDIAHMWTGKNVDGNTIGLAWIGVVCKLPTYAYGFSQIISSAPVKYAVSAHEIGHNFSAVHSDAQAGCADTIMNSSSSQNTLLQFCPFSVNEIKTYVNANSGCLAASTVTCTYTISPASKSFTSTGGSDRVSVTSACAWTATSNATWINITAGGSATGNGAVSYTVAPNTGTTSRTGTLTIAGKTFTITQSAPAAPALSAIRLSRALVPGCMTVTGTVILTAAAPVNGLLVTLSDNISSTAMPASVIVPAGATSKTFTITTVPVTANQAGSVTVKLGTVTKSALLTVRPMWVQTLSLSPNTVVGPNSVTGTAILECAAPAGGLVVALSSTDPTVAVPTASSMTIPAATKSKTFTVRTTDVSVSSSATIKATASGNTKTRTLKVN